MFHVKSDLEQEKISSIFQSQNQYAFRGSPALPVVLTACHCETLIQTGTEIAMSPLRNEPKRLLDKQQTNNICTLPFSNTLPVGFPIPGKRFEPTTHEASNYKVVMKLTIKEVDIGDFGTYKCVVKNSLGETDGSIKVYRKYREVAFALSFSCFHSYTTGCSCNGIVVEFQFRLSK